MIKQLMLAAFAVFSPLAAAADLFIGVTAPRGASPAEARWQAFADYMSAELGQGVQLVPVGAVEGTEVFLGGGIDVLLANPVMAAVTIDMMSGQPMASLVSSTGNTFAGVIVVRAESAVQSVADLRGGTVATLGDWAAGASSSRPSICMTRA